MSKNPLRLNRHVEVLKLSDPTKVRDGIEVLDQDVISLSDKPFLAKRILVVLEKITVIFQYSSHRLKTRTKLHPNLVAFVSIGHRSRGTIDGITMRPDMLISSAPGIEADIVVKAGYRSITLMISPDHLQKLFDGREHDTAYRLPKKIEFKAVDGAGIREFFNLGIQITDTAERNSDVFNDNKSARVSAEMDILESLKSVLVSPQINQTEAKSRDGTKSNYARIIKAIEAYTLENADRRIFVSELGQVTGVSERTLQGAFHEIMQMPPTAYLNRLRLHRAHRHLRRGSTSTNTVSAVALDWGFWHFGDFSKAYKKCFGEVPSNTLKRKAETVKKF